MLKTLALKVPRIKALASHRDALLSERNALLTERDRLLDALLSERDALLTERDRLLEAQGAAIRRTDELLLANSQLADALKHANGLPIPPRHLQERVAGGYFSDFLSSATHALSDFDRSLKSAGKRLAEFDHVLDLGVGCGRVIRRFHELHPQASLTGADIDSEAIAWLRQNYGSVGTFVTLPHFPPSELEAGAFDLVYAISVFSHLNEEMQFAWLGELQRITKAGAHLLLTVHGRKHQLMFPDDIQQRIVSRGFYYNEDSAVTDGLPSFYKSTIHTRDYVEREWSRFFEILHYEEQGHADYQDLILCRKRQG